MFALRKTFELNQVLGQGEINEVGDSNDRVGLLPYCVCLRPPTTLPVMF